MAINKNDVVFVESKVMADTSDGGGEMTARIIQSGQVGNVWPDISRLDRTTGAVEFRKLYMAVTTANAETYSGAHIIMDALPKDPRVNMFMMSLGDHYDTRLSARNTVESFVIKGGISPLSLNGDHLSDQKELNCWAPLGSELPKIGDSLVLIESGDLQTEQYIKIKNINSRLKRFTYYRANGFAEFTALSVQVSITEGLKRKFNSTPASPISSSPTKILKTQPSQGAQYYSCRPTVAAAQSGDLSVKVDTVQQSLFPVATREVPYIDLPVSSGGVLKSAGQPITLTVSCKPDDTGVWFLPRSIVPGSLSLNLAGSRYKEEGGELQLLSGTARFTRPALVSVFDGQIKYKSKGTYSGTVTYTPAMGGQQTVYNEAQEVTELTRGSNWTFTLSPPPAPGTVKASYLYSGDWVSIKDNGAGALVGTGSGTVDYNTGSVLVATEALPELGSAVLIQWSGDDFSPVPVIAPLTPEVQLYIQCPPLVGGFSIEWQANGQTKSISRSQLNGDFNGDGSLVIEPVGGDGCNLYLRPNALADNKQYTVIYDVSTDSSATDLINVPARSLAAGETQLEIQLDATPVFSSLSFGLLIAMEVEKTENRRILEGVTNTSTWATRKIQFYCQGNEIKRVGSRRTMGRVSAGGLITLDLDKFEFLQRVKVVQEQGSWPQRRTAVVSDETQNSNSIQVIADTAVRFDYQALNSAIAVEQTTITGPLVCRFSDLEAVKASCAFMINGDLHYDDYEGRLLKGFNTATGVGEIVGNVQYDYGNSSIVLDEYDSISPSIEVLAASEALSSPVNNISNGVFFLPFSPIRPGTVQVKFKNYEGDLFVLKADQFGVLYEVDRQNSGASISAVLPNANQLITYAKQRYGRTGAPRSLGGDNWGFINYETGLIYIDFKDDIPAQLVTINAVESNSIPLDSNIIGLNSVRMPSTGKVPVYRAGNVLVIHHSESIEIGTPAANATINTQRLDLATVEIKDAQGLALAPSQYTADLSAGVVAFDSALVLQSEAGAALTPPLNLSHRIETSALCSDVSLDGTLELAIPLERDMPAGSFVSCAITIGDMQARATNLFSQNTALPGDFSDAPTSGPTNARLNDLDYPIILDGRATVKDKWVIRFKSNTAFDVFSERRGALPGGSIVEDYAPINPVWGLPYFAIKKEAWGGGWQSGNVVRFNTAPSAAPLWLIRSIQPGKATYLKDGFSLQARGDTDQ